MNNLYNKPYVDVISVFLLHLEMMEDMFYKNEREMKVSNYYHRDEKLYNRPCLAVMLQFLLILYMILMGIIL